VKAVTSGQIQQLDKQAIEGLGIDSLFLMENAGRGVSQFVEEILNKKNNDKVVVICGKGNNGGDGFVVARHLLNRGKSVSVFLLGKKTDIKKDAEANLKKLKALNCEVAEIADEKSQKYFYDILPNSDILVDAIFGVGLKGQIKGIASDIISAMNKSNKPIVSIDVPSGLDSTTGEICGFCVKSTLTVSFTLAKRGFFLKNGPEYIGELSVIDIGIPKELVAKISHESS